MESQNNQRHPGPAGENISMSAKKKEKLSKLLSRTPEEKIRAALVKEETVQMRVTADDKAEMKQAAQMCRLSVSEYLTRCHQVVYDRLRHD